MELNRYIDSDDDKYVTVAFGTITVDKSIQNKIFFEINSQARNIASIHGEPKFCIMNKIAYQQYYAWCIENHRLVPDDIWGIPIVLDWTSEDLVKVKMGAFAEWKGLDLEDIEG